MVFHRMIRLALVVFFAVFVAGAVEACASGWEVLPDLPEARSGVAVASWEGKLFVFGGNNEGGKTNSVWEYDPETMQYNEKEAMPTARSSMGAVSYNDRIYVLGGHGTDDYTGAVDIYYPLTNTWAPGTDVPAPEGERAVVHEGIIYLMGGHNHPRCRAYDIEADTWSDIAPLPDPRGRGGAAVYGDKIYFFAGGYHGNHNDTYEYDIATNTWQRKASIPHALGNAVAGTIGDHIYVTGDAEASWEAYTFRYDPIADSWERVENCNYLGRSLDGAAIGNMLYKFGGGMPHPNPATPQTWAEVYVDTEAITDFYVDADDGDDGNDGSIDFPWKTITHALSQVTGTSSSPKTIHVLEGVYSYSNNEETFPLNVKSYVSLIGEDRETTILDAEGAAYHVIICDGVDAVIIEGLTATGGHASVPGSNNATGAVSNDDGGGVFCVNCTSVRIMDNVITGNQSYDDGGGIWCDNCEALIEGNEISSNVVGDDGGGISLWYGSVTVSDNLIRLNESPRNAGGIYWAFSFPLVEANVIAENIGGGSGGICGCGYQDGSVPGTARVVNNLVVNNYCERRCAGVMFWYTDAFVSSTTIAENGTDDAGSGLFAGTSTVEVVDSILWGNASTGSEVLLQYTSSVDITYSCIEGGYDGEGNINLDPEFLCGYYLSQAAAGQSVDSPCVNAGSASASTLGMDELTTRTDGVYDQGIVDMGYHYPTGYDYTVVVDTDGDPLSNTGPGYVYVYGPNLYFRDGETFLSPESGYIYFKGADESKGIKTAQMSVEAPISVLHVPFVNLDFDLGGDYGYIYLYGPNADFGHGDDYWVPLHAPYSYKARDDSKGISTGTLSESDATGQLAYTFVNLSFGLGGDYGHIYLYGPNADFRHGDDYWVPLHALYSYKARDDSKGISTATLSESDATGQLAYTFVNLAFDLGGDYGYIYLYGPNTYFRHGDEYWVPLHAPYSYKARDDSKGISTATLSESDATGQLAYAFVNLSFDLGGDYGYIYLYGPNADFRHGDDYWVPLHAPYSYKARDNSKAISTATLVEDDATGQLSYTFVNLDFDLNETGCFAYLYGPNQYFGHGEAYYVPVAASYSYKVKDSSKTISTSAMTGSGALHHACGAVEFGFDPSCDWTGPSLTYIYGPNLYIEDGGTYEVPAGVQFSIKGKDGSVWISGVVLTPPAITEWLVCTWQCDGSAEFGFGGLADGVWPMHQMNPKHTGRSPYRGPIEPVLKWSFQCEGSSACIPSIGPDSAIYLGTTAGKVYAVESNGSPRWTYSAPSGGEFMYSGPAIARDGTIYIGGASNDHRFHAIGSDGRLKWTYASSAYWSSSPSIGPDGTVYTGSEDHNLRAFEPNGTLKWSFTAANDVDCSPALATDGTIYFSSYYTGGLYAVDPDGTLKWQISKSNMGWATVTIDDDGTLYVPTGYDTHVWAVNPLDGSIIWDYDVGSRTYLTMALSDDGCLYIGDYDGRLTALNTNGTLKWRYHTGQIRASSPIIDDDGVIFFSTRNGDNGTVWAIHPDGSLVWSFGVEGMIGGQRGLSLGEDGTIYCVNANGVLYAIGEAPDDYYVNADTGDNLYDGLSPTYDGTHGPWKTITHALAHVDGAAERPKTIHVAAGKYADSTNDETFPLNMKSHVSLLGENRDTTILDAEEAAYHVIYLDLVDDAIIQGLTIRAGDACGGESDEDYQGAGVYARDSSVTVADCIITQNTALSGSSLTRGAGIYMLRCSATVSDSEISGNQAVYYGPGLMGEESDVVIDNSEIVGNTGEHAHGGGILLWFGTATITNNLVMDNEGHDGGGINIYDIDALVKNNLIVGNSAHDATGDPNGGGIHIWHGNPRIESNTIVGNSALSGGGGIHQSPYSTGSPTIINCIVWCNGDDLYNCAATYSCIEDGDSGTGNISDNPLFVTCNGSDYYLHPTSPCVDAGSQSAEDAGLDNRTTQCDGTPDSGTVDMGYHYPIP